jgi:hypothetical protein
VHLYKEITAAIVLKIDQPVLILERQGLPIDKYVGLRAVRSYQKISTSAKFTLYFVTFLRFSAYCNTATSQKAKEQKNYLRTINSVENFE